MRISLPMTLRPSPVKTLILMAVTAFFVVAGLWFARENPLVGYLCAGFFGLGFVVCAVSLLPSASYLRLTAEGFTFCSLFQSHTVAWSDVAEFFVVDLRHNRAVGWHYAPHYVDQSAGPALAIGLAGIEAALPDTYGLKAEDLAALMNDLLREYGQPTGGAEALT